MNDFRGIKCVSELSFPLPIWRYILIFQSWQQFRSWTIIVSGSALSFYFFIKYFTDKSLPIEIILPGMTLGSIFSVVMVVPVEVRFKIKTDQLQRILVNRLYEIGYIQESAAEGTKVFRQRLPSWLRWNEGNVAIEKHNDEILVKGGIAILAKLRHCVKTSYSGH